MRTSVSKRAALSRTAAEARRALRRLARPVGVFDASRYFRGAVDLGFHNVGAGEVRALARSIHAAHRHEWSLDDALSFADMLIRDRYLEVKGVGIEVVARYRREFTPRNLPVWKRWLAGGCSANWATTDAICGYLIGPLLATAPGLARKMPLWARHRSLWVRRASAVSLVAQARRGQLLDLAYAVVRRLQADKEDLIQKAVGWLLREAGRTDMRRLQRYLLLHGPEVSRTSVRYAIERLPPAQRQRMLRLTRARGRRG